MKKMTSANVNKLIKKLQDDKQYLLARERDTYTYTASENETPVIPEYDYMNTAKELLEIDDKIVALKHTLNVVNSTHSLDIEGKMMTIDEILVRMAQLNSRKSMLDTMRKMQKKSRVNRYSGYSGNAAPEYQYANFDIEFAIADYKRADELITKMQLALDKFNQTFEFDVDID